MYEKLTEKFLSMKWDQNYLTNLNASVSDEEIIPMLDKAFPDWTFKITHMAGGVDFSLVGGTLFLPGRMIDGTGEDEWCAIRNIIDKLTAKVNSTQTVQTQIPQNAPEQAVINSVSIMQQVADIKNKTQSSPSESQTSTAEALLNELMGSVTPTQSEPELVDFDSPQAQAQREEFLNQQNNLKTPTAEEVNPNNEYMIPKWQTEQGNALKTWMDKHNVTSKEQMSSWFIRYCNLDYDRFNPEWLDRFIKWTEALQETQTY